MSEYNIFYSNIITIPFISYLLSTILKWVFLKISTDKWNLVNFFSSWWMPSAHSSVVVSLSTALAIKYGVSSDYFAIAMSFTAIIIYDAINVRFEAGLHATAINQSLWQKKFKESLWHRPSEAFAGSILWIIVAVILNFF